MLIPFNKSSIVGCELAYIQDSINRGHISGDGYYTTQCQTLLERELDATKVLLTTSCTDALEMAALLLDIQPGDEVIVPAFTFVSTVNAFVLRGARPAFADIRSDTLNIDEKLVERLITPRTKAIVVVHYAGVGCEMDTLMALTSHHNIALIEDNAHGLFGRYKGKCLGSFGCIATQSFHETKNISCGEGGALLLNDECYLEKAEIIREKGTNRSLFFRGQVDKYTWVDIGSSYLPSDMLAAYLFAQLEKRSQVQARRKQIWDRYYESLMSWAAYNDVTLPFVPGHCDQAYHMFYLLLPTLDKRQSFIAHLKRNDILSVFHYLPLHLSPMGQKYDSKIGDCPVTESISDKIVRLPFYNSLSPGEHQKVIDTILSYTI